MAMLMSFAGALAASSPAPTTTQPEAGAQPIGGGPRGGPDARGAAAGGAEAAASRAVRERPDDPALLFLVAQASIAAARRKHLEAETRTIFLDTAIAALRRMPVRNPELVRVRPELARAFFLKEEDTLGRRHFERVLAGKPLAGVRRVPGGLPMNLSLTACDDRGCPRHGGNLRRTGLPVDR